MTSQQKFRKRNPTYARDFMRKVRKRQPGKSRVRLLGVLVNVEGPALKNLVDIDARHGR